MVSLDRLTEESRDAPQEAVRIASAEAHPLVEPEHLVLAFLRQEGGIAEVLFAGPEASARGHFSEFHPLLASFPRVPGPLSRGLSPRTESLFAGALSEADELGDERLSGGHFLLAIISGPGAAAVLLHRHGASRDGNLAAIASARLSRRAAGARPGKGVSGGRQSMRTEVRNRLDEIDRFRPPGIPRIWRESLRSSSGS